MQYLRMFVMSLLHRNRLQVCVYGFKAQPKAEIYIPGTEMQSLVGKCLPFELETKSISAKLTNVFRYRIVPVPPSQAIALSKETKTMDVVESFNRLAELLD